MSPELFDPERFNLEDSRQTKHSDCFALAMVIYEVLSGRVPFSRLHGPAIIGAIIKGERPERPRGKWFTDGIWSVIERCWKPSPGDRPSIEDVLQCLEGVSWPWTSPSPQMMVDLPITDSRAQNPDPSTEESTDESEAPSPSHPLREFPPEGDPNSNSSYPSVHWLSAAPRGTLDCRGLKANTMNPNGPDSEEPGGVPDRVSRAAVPCGSWR